MSLKVFGEPKFFNPRPDVDDTVSFVDGFCFTEDNVKVYNIYMHGIDKTLEQAVIAAYLSTYGELVTCVIHKARRSQTQLNGLAKFVDASVAANFLQQGKHKIGEKRFYAKASYSWFQPNCDKVLTAVSKSTAVDSPNNQLQLDFNELESKILDLNNDCLNLILRELDLRSQIMFARTCDRFLGIFQDFAVVKYKEVDLALFQSLTLWDHFSFFSFCGENIRKLYGMIQPKYANSVYHYIAQYCTKLQELRLSSNKLQMHQLRKLCHSNSPIKDLYLLYCNVGDIVFQHVARLPKLETLIISNNYQIQGKGLCKVKKVKRLSLSFCPKLHTNSFISAIKAMKLLQCLDIRGCTALGQSVYKAIAVHCKQVDALHISPATGGYEDIAQLPKLRELTVIHTSKATTDIVLQLSKHKAEQLEILSVANLPSMDDIMATQICEFKNLKELSLGMDSVANEFFRVLANLKNLKKLNIKNCKEFKNAALVSLIEECRTLKCLNVEYCYQLSDDFVTQVINVMRKQPERVPLKVITSQFLISEASIELAKPFVQIVAADNNDEDSKNFLPFADTLSTDFMAYTDDENDDYHLDHMYWNYGDFEDSDSDYMYSDSDFMYSDSDYNYYDSDDGEDEYMRHLFPEFC